MRKEIVLSNIGLFSGVAGIVIAAIPLLSENKLFGGLNNAILPISLGVIGFILSFDQRKKLNDDVVKAGLVLSSIATAAGIVLLITLLI